MLISSVRQRWARKEGLHIAKHYRINQSIPARDYRVIDSEGKMLGVISRDEAFKIAQEQGFDLVEIAPNINPPIARILDFEKFRYEESKKEKAAKKHAKDVELKELWFSPRIAEHDLLTRLRKAEEFIKDNNKILIRIKFRGREMGHQEFGTRVMQKIFEVLGDKIQVEREPKFEGRSLTAIIGRSNGKPKEEKDDAESKD